MRQNHVSVTRLIPETIVMSPGALQGQATPIPTEDWKGESLIKFHQVLLLGEGLRGPWMCQTLRMGKKIEMLNKESKNGGKGTAGVAQWLECSTGTHEALSSSPATAHTTCDEDTHL